MHGISSIRTALAGIAVVAGLACAASAGAVTLTDMSGHDFGWDGGPPMPARYQAWLDGSPYAKCRK